MSLESVWGTDWVIATQLVSQAHPSQAQAAFKGLRVTPPLAHCCIMVLRDILDHLGHGSSLVRCSAWPPQGIGIPGDPVFLFCQLRALVFSFFCLQILKHHSSQYPG